mgnify:CR=1 FL=1
MAWQKIKSYYLEKKQKVVNMDQNGLIVFYVVEEAIKAEKVLKNSGISCKLVAPPPDLRKGCDLALEINLLEQPFIERLFTPEIPYQGIFPLSGTTEILPIVKTVTYAGYTMVKAGNMKITFANNTGMIVNTSGGGCPDIPYLNMQMVGKHLLEAPRPKDLGYTLCALMLDRAYEECLYLWNRRETVCF